MRKSRTLLLIAAMAVTLCLPAFAYAANGISQISAGEYHSTLVQDDGTLWAWGYNEMGQVGNGTIGGLVTTPTQIFLEKADNTLTVKGKTATVKYASLQKGKQTLAPKKVLSVNGAKGTVIYQKKSGNKKITINKKTGKVTVKKGLKKGKTYKVKVKVTAAGNRTYQSGTKTATFKIKVK